jgi:hypothetical protein
MAHSVVGGFGSMAYEAPLRPQAGEVPTHRADYR